MKSALLLIASTLLLAGCNDTEAYRLKALEERVDDLEVSKLVNQPFLRDVSQQEMLLLMEFSLAVQKLQISGFQFSYAVAGSHGTSFTFKRGSETLTKIVMIR